MKKKYYVNNIPQINGDHEVHAVDCNYLHLMIAKTYLGEFSTCAEAVMAARKIYLTANGCFYCSRPCHTR